MGPNYSFYVKTIETHARAFFKVIIFSIGSMSDFDLVIGYYYSLDIENITAFLKQNILSLAGVTA